jgi:hypothetical protein
VAANDARERLLALFDKDPAALERLLESVQKVTVKPHAAQLPVIQSKARFKVMNCGRRFGKTTLAAKMILTAARKQKQMLWWVAPTYRIVKRGYEEVLRQLPEGVLAKPAPPSTNFDAGRPIILQFKNGTKLEFYSAERPEGMLGAAVDFVVIDEAARMKSNIWNETISPTLIDHKGSCLMISTPRGRNWFYQCWQKGQDPNDPDWDSWTFTTQDNPHLPEGEADRMAADMPRMEADQEIYAKWLAAGSTVFVIPDGSVQEPATILKDFTIAENPPEGFVVLGIDLARTSDWTVLYGANSRNRRNCYFERMQAITWPEQKRRIRRAVRTLRRAGAEDVLLMVDSTGVGDPIFEDLSNDGYDVVGINFTTHKTNMVRLLAKDIEERAAFVLRTRLTEFEDYQMTMTPAGRMTYSAPDGAGMYDDVVAAKMLQHWGLINESAGDISVISIDEPEIKPAPRQAPPTGDNVDGEDVNFEFAEDDYSDWIDPDLDLSEEDAVHAIGGSSLADLHMRLLKPPDPDELLRQGVGFDDSFH